MRILVVAAHPDDEVLGCGATMARLSDQGNDIHAAILGEGITSRYTTPGQTASAETESLRAACYKAARIMGIRETVLHQLPDNRFDTVPLLEVVKIVESLIGRIHPDTVYTHHGGDLNIDHVITHRAVLTALRPTDKCPVRDIYAFEVASSTEWALQQFPPVFKPTVFSDISGTIDRKTDAMACYESEIRPFPHPRSPAAIRANAKRWGTVAGLEFVEAFELIRSIR